MFRKIGLPIVAGLMLAVVPTVSFAEEYETNNVFTVVVETEEKEFQNNFVFEISEKDDVSDMINHLHTKEIEKEILRTERKAEAARVYRMIEEENQREAEEAAAAAKEAERQKQLIEANAVEVKDNAVLSYNPFFKSGLTVEQFNTILEGTGLEGCGESYYNMENTYGVNGIFAISVAFHESGYGKYRANTNNFYGMRGSSGWMAFSSPDSNIQYFGELMNEGWYKGKTIDGIGAVYCPGTSASWASAVKAMMRNCFAKI